MTRHGAVMRPRSVQALKPLHHVHAAPITKAVCHWILGTPAYRYRPSATVLKGPGPTVNQIKKARCIAGSSAVHPVKCVSLESTPVLCQCPPLATGTYTPYTALGTHPRLDRSSMKATAYPSVARLCAYLGRNFQHPNIHPRAVPAAVRLLSRLTSC